MTLYHWQPGTFSPAIEALAEDILGKCICSESHKGRGMCGMECSFCNEIESVERTRARVLDEVRAAVEECDRSGERLNFRYDSILALFDKGGPLDPGSEGK